MGFRQLRFDNTNSKVVEYAYNAWGKPLYTSGSLTATLGSLTGATSMMQKRASTTSGAGITTLTYLWNDEQKNNPYWYLLDKSIDVSSTTLFP